MSTEEKEGKQRNEEIENQLKRDRMQQRNEIKMLLLGAPTSCTQKSTKLPSNLILDQEPASLANQPSSNR